MIGTILLFKGKFKRLHNGQIPQGFALILWHFVSGNWIVLLHLQQFLFGFQQCLNHYLPLTKRFQPVKPRFNNYLLAVGKTRFIRLIGIVKPVMDIPGNIQRSFACLPVFG